MKSFMQISHWIIPRSWTGLLSTWLWLLSPHQRTRSWPLDPSFRSWGTRAFCPPFAEETTDRKFKLKVKQCPIRSESRTMTVLWRFIWIDGIYFNHPSRYYRWRQKLYLSPIALWVGSSLLSIKLFGQQFCEMFRIQYRNITSQVIKCIRNVSLYLKTI